MRMPDRERDKLERSVNPIPVKLFPNSWLVMVVVLSLMFKYELDLRFVSIFNSTLSPKCFL